MLSFTRSFPIPATKAGSCLCLSHSASSGFAEFSLFKSLLLLLSSLVTLEEFQLPFRVSLQKTGLFRQPPQRTPVQTKHSCQNSVCSPESTKQSGRGGANTFTITHPPHRNILDTSLAAWTSTGSSSHHVFAAGNLLLALKQKRCWKQKAHKWNQRQQFVPWPDYLSKNIVNKLQNTGVSNPREDYGPITRCKWIG